jgi:predicted DNA-binding transcriptional regulator YafY
VTRDELEAACAWSQHPNGRANQAARLSRIEDYLFIGGHKLTQSNAAARLGVTVRTIQRYRQALRTMAGTR